MVVTLEVFNVELLIKDRALAGTLCKRSRAGVNPSYPESNDPPKFVAAGIPENFPIFLSARKFSTLYP